MALLKLLRYTGIPQVINKNTQPVTEIEGDFKQPFSLMNPIFQLQGLILQDHLTNNDGNYVQIDNSYYYLMDWQIMPNRMIEVKLHLDVLMTYKSEIAKLTIMLERSSTAENKDIQDSMQPLSADKEIIAKDFPRGFSEEEDDGVYVMVTAQNGYTPV